MKVTYNIIIKTTKLKLIIFQCEVKITKDNVLNLKLKLEELFFAQESGLVLAEQRVQ